MAHSPQRIKQHIEVIEARAAALRDILNAPESSPQGLSRGNPLEAGIRRQYEKELKHLEAGIHYWRGEYRKLTGTSAGPGAKTFTEMNRERQEKQKAENQLRLARQGLQHETDKAKLSLDLLVTRLQHARKHAADHWVVAFLVHQAGGVSYMTTWFIEKNVVPRAQAALKKSKELTARGELAKAAVHVQEAARWINRGFRDLYEYEEALGMGAERVELTIKLSAAIATGGLTGAGSLSGGQAVALEMVGTGAQEGTMLAAEAASGGVVGKKHITDAVIRTLIAGGSKAAGEFGKSMLSKPIADVLFRGKATPAQLKVVEDLVAGYYSANSQQLLETFKKIHDGEKVGYDAWSGLIAPAVKAIAPKLDAPVTVVSEQKVRDELQAMAKGKGGAS
jgi:hypothetical protein